MVKFSLSMCTALTALASVASAQAPLCYDFTSVDARMTRIVTTQSLSGASLSLSRPDRLLHRKTYGSYTGSEIVQIASASKWITGVLVMSQVDDQKIQLDDPLSKWFGPNLPGLMGQATIRQCMCHCAGFAAQHDALGDLTLTLEQAVNRILATPLRQSPGANFVYGGVSMHIVGRILEIASGKDLYVLLQERILNPLGMRSVDYNGFGVTKNYRSAGGMRCSLDDYMKLLVMLMNEGVYGTQRVLSAAAVREMFKDQTAGARIVFTPQPDDRRYGVGIWRDRVAASGSILQASSQGASGCSPWIDFERGLAGVVLLVDELRDVYGDIDRLQAETRSIVDWEGLLCLGRATSSCNGPVAIRGSSAPRSGDASFALRCARAAPLTAGAMLIAAKNLDQGLPFFGGELWVDLTTLILLPIATDGLGEATLPLPLTGVPPGLRVVAQAAFFETATCGQVGQIDSSAALEITALH